MPRLWKICRGDGRLHFENSYFMRLEDAHIRWYQVFGVGAFMSAAADQFWIREVDWVEREHWLYEHHYVKPVWHKVFTPILYHYAHVCEKDPSLIAFTLDADHGARVRYTTMKPGRYLNRYYPHLTIREVANYAEWWEKGKLPVAHQWEVKYGSSPDDFMEVYEHGPHSCMKGNPAVKAYGAGDLQIAYLEQSAASKTCPYKYPARAIVWPAKKAFGRIFPTNGDWRGAEKYAVYLETHFRNLGYRGIYDDSRVLDGARITKIKRSYGGYLVPFLDNTSLAHHPTDPNYFIIKAGGALGGGNSSGMMDAPPEQVTCANPGCRRRFAEHTGLGVRLFYRGTNVQICPSCARRTRGELIFQCNGTTTWYLLNRDNPAARPVSVWTWVTAYGTDHQARCLTYNEAWLDEPHNKKPKTYTCGKTGERWMLDSHAKYVKRLDGTDELWSPRAHKAGGLTTRPVTIGDFYVRVEEAEEWVKRMRAVRRASTTLSPVRKAPQFENLKRNVSESGSIFWTWTSLDRDDNIIFHHSYTDPTDFS